MKGFLILLFLFYFLFLSFISTADSYCIGINTASNQELEKITGIGPVLAQKIIDARPFSSLDELVRVSGIAEKKLAIIKEQGLACLYCEQQEQVQEKENVKEDNSSFPTSLSRDENSVVKEDKSSKEEKEEDTKISRQINNKTPNSWHIFLIGIAVSFFSGIIILILKRKMIK